MNEDIINAYYSPILNHRYEQWFQERHYNEDEFSDKDRKEYLEMVEEATSHYLSGLPTMQGALDWFKSSHDEYHATYCVVISAIQFILMTMIDGMVLSKFFLLAEKDYEQSLLRGKLKVILNEGFKKLYGFDKKTNKKSEWNKLASVLNFFPDEIKLQYQHLSSLLEKHATSSSWWKDERDEETHLDTEKLYASRCEKIKESQVIIDFLKLFETLNAVNLFLTNMHACLNNYLVDKYRRGELQDVKNILCTNEQTTTSSQNMGIGK